MWRFASAVGRTVDEHVCSFELEAALLPADQAVDEEEKRQPESHAPELESMLHGVSQQPRRSEIDDRSHDRLGHLLELLVGSVVTTERIRVLQSQSLDLLAEPAKLLIVLGQVAIESYLALIEPLPLEKLDVLGEHAVGQREVIGQLDRRQAQQIVTFHGQKIHPRVLRAGVDQDERRGDHHNHARHKHRDQSLAALQVTKHRCLLPFRTVWDCSKLLCEEPT